jgi:acetyl esterase
MPRAELAALFEMMRGAPQPQSIAELRAQMEAFRPIVNSNPPEVGRMERGVVIDDAVRCDVIVPPGSPPHATLLYLHGGGWSIGSPATHEKLARQLCVGAGVVVVSVDYRLAPEHPFPSPLEDCVAAARWTRANVARYGGDPQRLAIGGDSAGANLSAAVINDLRAEISFRAALLLYGAYDLIASRRDYDRHAPGGDPVLPKEQMDLMLGAYLGGGADPDDPRMSPLKADLRGFPPACLICGDADPLWGESLHMREALRQRGCEATLHRYREMPHAFLQLPVSEAGEAIETACRFLTRHLRAA